MKTFLYVALIIAALPQLQAQQSAIYGEVSILNSQTETGKREYVPNAAVEEDFGKSQATTTQADGTFKLVLVGIPEHDGFQFTVKKPGLDVVNTDALNAVTNQRDKLKIYMAPPGKIADYRKTYYRVGKTAAEKALEEKLKSVQAERTRLKTNEAANEMRIGELEVQLAQLEIQRQKIDDAAKELARRYAPVNLDDTSPTYREAFSFFQQGDMTQALAILQNANYAEQVRKILEERDSIAAGTQRLDQRDAIQQQRTRDAIQGLSLQADLYKTHLEFDSIARCYEMMLQLDSANINILRQYAYFLAYQNDHTRAIVFYKKALLLAKTDETKATLLNNLGNANRAAHQMSDAGTAYAEALKLFRKLSESSPDEYLPYVALTLNNLGNYYRKTNKPNSEKMDLQKAETSFSEALRIYKRLSEKKSDDYQPYVALTLNNLGRVHYEDRNMFRAKSAFEESIDIYERLAESNPNAIIPSDIQEFLDLSLTYSDHDKEAYMFDKYSEALLTRALGIHRKLAEKNPAVFLPFVALTLNNLGNLFANHYKKEKAEAAYNEALKIHREMAENNPKAFYPYVVHTLRSMGNFYKKNRRIAESEAAFAEADGIEKKYEGK